MPLDVVLLFGSMRRDRQGIRLARFLDHQVRERGHKATLIDAMECKLPLLDRMYKEYEPGTAPEALERIARIIKPADGFLIVSGEYNHGIQPGLKNLLDHFLEEWFYRPSAIACYSAGGFGGVRAAMQLRMTLGELGMPSISSIFAQPKGSRRFRGGRHAHERRAGPPSGTLPGRVRMAYGGPQGATRQGSAALAVDQAQPGEKHGRDDHPEGR